MAQAFTKPIDRIVNVDGREYVATFAAAGVFLREKGKRTTYGPVPYSHIFMAGARMMANENMANRRKAG